VSTYPDEWRWQELFDAGEQQFRRGRLARNYEVISPGDLVFGYTASPEKRIEVLARVARLTQAEGSATFVLAPLTRVAEGPTWDELQADEFLSGSEPLRNRMQGTLFQVLPEESERLMALVAERDPDAASAATSIEMAAPDQRADPIGDSLEWVTFHPSFSYEDFVEGFRPARSDGGAALSLEDGTFKTMCGRALANPERTYLLVIDDVNRAHVTKVLGELITLIEKDKRARDTQSLYSIRLPYSKERFVVPPNLFILGTMNTADRSIRMLDTALRRRFGFVELMPDPGLLVSKVGGLPLDDLLRALNRRVAKEAGREKQIGHSFFLKGGQPIADEAEFTEIFRDEIVPLFRDEIVPLLPFAGVRRRRLRRVGRVPRPKDRRSRGAHLQMTRSSATRRACSPPSRSTYSAAPQRCDRYRTADRLPSIALDEWRSGTCPAVAMTDRDLRLAPRLRDRPRDARLDVAMVVGAAKEGTARAEAGRRGVVLTELMEEEVPLGISC
jgi:hypothetical protein